MYNYFIDLSTTCTKENRILFWSSWVFVKLTWIILVSRILRLHWQIWRISDEAKAGSVQNWFQNRSRPPVYLISLPESQIAVKSAQAWGETIWSSKRNWIILWWARLLTLEKLVQSLAKKVRKQSPLSKKQYLIPRLQTGSIWTQAQRS